MTQVHNVMHLWTLTPLWRDRATDDAARGAIDRRRKFLTFSIKGKLIS